MIIYDYINKIKFNWSLKNIFFTFNLTHADITQFYKIVAFKKKITMHVQIMQLLFLVLFLIVV